MQLDYKEDLVDYIEDIDNYWGKEEVKLISFYVPKTAAIDSLYEVKLTEVEKIEEV